MLSYKEQLLHPKWQRRRLEILSQHDFKCTACGSADKTLHVHHKVYVSGRMAWEYEDDDLAPLCEACHAAQHRWRELLAREVAELDASSAASAQALLVGFRCGLVESEGVPPEYADSILIPSVESSKHYWIGQIARHLSNNATAEEVSTLYHATIHGSDLGAVIQAAYETWSCRAAARNAAATQIPALPAPSDE